MMMMNMMTSHLHTVVVWWLSVCVGSLLAQPRIFMTARAGSSVVLPCEWRDALRQKPHIEWRTISETVFERNGEEQFQGEGYEDRVDVPEDRLLKGNCSLVLKNVRPADEGVYESYLMVKRTKRSLQTKRVFIQSVELSVEDSPEERVDENVDPPVKGDAGVDRLPPQIMALSLLSFVLFHVV